MIVKDIISEDFLQYSKPSMFIITTKCSFKCEKDSGCPGMCQNAKVVLQPDVQVANSKIVSMYEQNKITQAIVFGGLEPFDTFEEMLALIQEFRTKLNDDIVIYTGYTESEISDKVEILKQFKNIIVKFGRYVPNTSARYDEVLGVHVASPNQYARRIS